MKDEVNSILINRVANGFMVNSDPPTGEFKLFSYNDLKIFQELGEEQLSYIGDSIQPHQTLVGFIIESFKPRSDA